MKTYSVFLGLGSNMGERQRYLQQAADGTNKIRETKVVWVSSVYETEPWGKTDQPRFLNACVEIETSLTPAELVVETKAVEQNIGRTSAGHWGPREIDVDILLYDGLVFEGEDVTVPHPELENRRFVLVPLQEIAPDLVHPVNGMTVSELVSASKDKGRVVKTPHHILL